MIISNDIVYMPSVRTSTYNLGALRELDIATRAKLLPRIIVRGDNSSDLDSFLNDWGNSPLLLETSTYALDIACDLNVLLNNPKDHYAEKFKFFSEKASISKNLIPVISHKNGENLRDIVQLSLKLSNHFELIGILLDVSRNFEKSLDVLNSILAALSDEDISKTILIVDAGKIDNLNQINSDNLKETFALIQKYKFHCVITSSTSYPTSRPTPGETATHACIDPIWQNIFNSQLLKTNIKGLYGDYAATDPSGEAIEFDFAVHPIPYATYLLDNSFEWFTLREGKGGEYEKFRSIAAKIRSQDGYHGDEFCYATRQIKSIAEHSRKKAGNQAYWNKLKINQHISAIIKSHNDNYLNRIGLSHNQEDNEED